jgi:hypothetical protein
VVLSLLQTLTNLCSSSACGNAVVLLTSASQFQYITGAVCVRMQCNPSGEGYQLLGLDRVAYENALDLYSRNTRFDYRPEHQLS